MYCIITFAEQALFVIGGGYIIYWGSIDLLIRKQRSKILEANSSFFSALITDYEFTELLRSKDAFYMIHCKFINRKIETKK